MKRALLKSPPADLFDEPASEWLGTSHVSYLSHPVATLIDELAAMLVDTTPGLSAARLWKWQPAFATTSGHRFHRTCGALRDWIDRDRDREAELFEAILNTEDVTFATSVVADTYKRDTGKSPSLTLVQLVLQRAATANTSGECERFLLHAIALARDPDAGTEAFWDTYDAIEGYGLAELLPALTVHELSPYHFSGARRKIEESRDAQEARADNISQLLPRLDDLRNGTLFGTLYWAADKYLESRSSTDDLPAGLDGIIRFTTEAIADAIVQGWEQLIVSAATTTTTALGTAEKEGTISNSEFVIIAALDALHESHRISQIVALPIVPLVALRSASLLKNTARQERLHKWAERRLDDMGEAGVTELLTFWNTALDLGATSLTGAWQLLDHGSPVPVAVEALQRLLSTRRRMSPEALWSGVRLLVTVSPRELVLEIATSALSDGATPKNCEVFGASSI